MRFTSAPKNGTTSRLEWLSDNDYSKLNVDSSSEKSEIIPIKKCLCLFNRAKIVLKLELGLGLGLVS